MVGCALPVVLVMGKGALLELEMVGKTMPPVPTGGAVVVLFMEKELELEKVLELDMVGKEARPVPVPMGMVEVVLLPIVKGMLLELETEEEVMEEEDEGMMGDPVPVGPADMVVLLPMVKGMLELDMDEEVMEEEEPVPIGKAEVVVLPMVK